MTIKWLRRVLVLMPAMFCLLSGCAMTPPPLKTAAERPSDAVAFFHNLDAAVAHWGVRDAAAAPVAGFPYLRADRFLAAMAPRRQDEGEATAWIDAMAALDRDARRREIGNLPPVALADAPSGAGALGHGTRADLMALADRYAAELLAHDRRAPGYARAVAEAVSVPDEYRTAMRVAGLYPLAVVPVAVVTEHVNRRFVEWHRESWDRLETRGRLIRYDPAASDLPPVDPRRIHAAQGRDPMGRPRLTADDADALVWQFAPVIVQDTAAEYDRWGRVAWDGDLPQVNGAQPVIYHYISHAFFKGAPILQLNYTLWHPARQGPDAPRIEHGRLDGLTIRISLDTSGTPFMVDVMNNCGCYHFFVPKKGRILGVLPQPGALPPLVARWLPAAFPDERLLVRISSGWHQAVHLATAGAAADSPSRTYGLQSYETLERLPRGDGTSESLFDAEGIAKGSGRIEPYIFFSMGIPRIGSMRQRGRHAVRMVGRAHFDDPDLFDRIFRFK